MSSTSLNENIVKMKELLERLNQNINQIIDKNHPRYRLEATDNVYKALKSKKGEIIEKINSPISESERENFKTLLNEVDKLLSLIGPAISDKQLALEGGVKKRNRRSKRNRHYKRNRRSKKNRHSKKNRRSKRNRYK